MREQRAKDLQRTLRRFQQADAALARDELHTSARAEEYLAARREHQAAISAAEAEGSEGQ